MYIMVMKASSFNNFHVVIVSFYRILILLFFLQVKIDPEVFTDIKSDVEFAALLVEEESVVVLPGEHLCTWEPSFLLISVYLSYQWS